MHKKISELQKQRYRRLLNRVKRTKDIGHMKKIILDYTSYRSNHFPSMDVDMNGLGDSNGDGLINILDVLQLIQFILGNPETIQNHGEQILSSCNVVYNEETQSLIKSDKPTPDISSVVSLVSFILSSDSLQI